MWEIIWINPDIDGFKQDDINHYQAVLLAMVQPMSCPSGSDQSLKLVRLDPDEFLYLFVSPQPQTLSPKFHGSGKNKWKHRYLTKYLHTRSIRGGILKKATHSLWNTLMHLTILYIVPQPWTTWECGPPLGGPYAWTPYQHTLYIVQSSYSEIFYSVPQFTPFDLFLWST